MKHIYWCIQQKQMLGGSELVTIDLINHLINYYDITLITTFDDGTATTPYQIDPRVKILSLNINIKLARYFDNLISYLKHFHLIKAIKLQASITHHFLFKRRKYKKYLQSLLKTDNDIMIFSSIENYYLAPKKGKRYYHYHFNSTAFFKFITQLGLHCSNKPTKFIFLSKTTYKNISNKKKKLKDSTYINNLCRFNPVKNFEFHNNNILFVGRYTAQKNPILALKIANELKKKNFEFHMHFFGEGEEKDKILSYVKENNLDKYVSINSPTNNIQQEFLSNDLLLMTSLYEGMPLIIKEAQAHCLPIISSNWGEEINEMIENNIDGYIIENENIEEYADKIINLLSDKDKLKEFKENSYKKSINNNNDMIINKWKELIES